MLGIAVRIPAIERALDDHRRKHMVLDQQVGAFGSCPLTKSSPVSSTARECRFHPPNSCLESKGLSGLRANANSSEPTNAEPEISKKPAL